MNTSRDRGDPRQFSPGESKHRETDQEKFEQEKPRNPQGADADRLKPTRDKHTGETNRNPQEIDPARGSARALAEPETHSCPVNIQ